MCLKPDKTTFPHWFFMRLGPSVDYMNNEICIDYSMFLGSNTIRIIILVDRIFEYC